MKETQFLSQKPHQNDKTARNFHPKWFKHGSYIDQLTESRRQYNVYYLYTQSILTASSYVTQVRWPYGPFFIIQILGGRF